MGVCAGRTVEAWAPGGKKIRSGEILESRPTSLTHPGSSISLEFIGGKHSWFVCPPCASTADAVPGYVNDISGSPSPCSPHGKKMKVRGGPKQKLAVAGAKLGRGKGGVPVGGTRARNTG